MKYKKRNTILFPLLVTSSLVAGLDNRTSSKDTEYLSVNSRTEYSINNFDSEFDEDYWNQEISLNSDPDLSNVIHSILMIQLLKAPALCN